MSLTASRTRCVAGVAVVAALLAVAGAATVRERDVAAAIPSLASPRRAEDGAPTPDLPPSGWVHCASASWRPAPPRRPPSEPLPLDHPLLRRRASSPRSSLVSSAASTAAAAAADPHAPEQVMLSLDGPGTMTATWVTHPQVSVRVGGCGEQNGAEQRPGFLFSPRAVAGSLIFIPFHPPRTRSSPC